MTYVRFVLSTAVCAIVLAGCIPPVDSLDAPATRYESTDGQYWLEFTGEDRVEFRLDIPTHEESDARACFADGEHVTESNGTLRMPYSYQMSVFHDVDENVVPILIYLEGSGDWGRLWVRPCGLDYDGIALLPVGEDEQWAFRQ